MLVLGGAASGKSAWAESWVKGRNLPKIYVATAAAGDTEMAQKIAKHRVQRGPDWETLEIPHALADTLHALPPGRAVLVDCASMWLSNLMLRGDDLDQATQTLVTALAACPADVTIVTNEVGQGIVPDNALARRFREAQGRLNIQLAQQATRVVQIVAGLPNVLKGDI